MKSILLMSVFLITSCGINSDDNYYVIKVGENETEYLRDIDACPKVHIKRKDSVIVQKEGNTNAFEIVALGYSGHCYFNKNVNKTKAIIRPEFKIVRLSDVDDTDVHFSYYLETVEGPEAYLGKKTYFAKVTIPKGTKEIGYIPNETAELSIPEHRKENADIYFGLNEDTSEMQFKK